MAGTGGSVATCAWDNNENEFLMEEVAALDPVRGSNAMLTQNKIMATFLTKTQQFISP